MPLRENVQALEAMIAVDWGSSSLRAYRLDAGGRIIDARHAALGVLTCGSGFETTLRQWVVGWDDRLIVLAGMVGSRQGWLEVPYVECPATLTDIASGMKQIDSAALADRSVWIVPGLLYRGTTKNGADVLRGEETQLFGLLQGSRAQRQLVCMPGTHSKWVVAERGRVESLFTTMTGELFDVLRKHSLLGRLMPEGGNAFDRSACKQGIERAREPGGLLHHLFSVRTSGLLGTLAPGQLASYLSGMLIAHEVLEFPCLTELRGQSVQVVGSSTVLEPYSFVMRELGLTVEPHDETCTAAGAHLLAKHRGLLRAANT
jgi:2-dehydro-3-deoxygalactonokinase